VNIDEIQMKFYGCGALIPLALDGMKVLDLGAIGLPDHYFDIVISKNARPTLFL
jgi:hypothetical protein